MATTFGRYTLQRRVAVGGMAEIWKAKVIGPAGFEKTVAIKRVLPHLVEDAEFIEMFIEEAKLVADLVHPNIVQVFDFGKVGPTEYFIAMEYVPGANLAALHKRATEKGERVPPGASLYLVAEACKGLGYAHEKSDFAGQPLRIVHRDVSPQNLLVNYGGDVKVSDFGIAKAVSASSRTGVGQIRGKLSYMSPEQANSRSLDGRSDLFSLGLVLYELLSGRKLLGGGSATEIFARAAGYSGITAEELEPVPPMLREIVERAVDPDPEKRYASAVEMERALTAPLGTAGLLRARQSLASMLQGLFDAERQLEMMPTDPGISAGSDAGAGAEAGMHAGGAIQSPEPEMVPTPGTPAKGSGLTLAPGQVDVREGPEAKPSVPAASRPAIPYAILGISLIAIFLLAVLTTWALRPKADLAESTPYGTPEGAVADASGTTPVSSPTPSSSPIEVEPTPAAAVVKTPARAAQGTLVVTSRPWVQVWLGKRLLAQETPLKDLRLPAGTHRIRFANPGLGFDRTHTVRVPADGTVTVHVDIRKNTIQVR